MRHHIPQASRQQVVVLVDDHETRQPPTAGRIAADDEGDITRALALFDEHVDVDAFAERVITTRTSTVTPKMFEYGLIQKARTSPQRIVLPEGEEERIGRGCT